MSIWAMYPIKVTNKVEETIDEKIVFLIFSLLLLLQKKAKIKERDIIIKNKR